VKNLKVPTLGEATEKVVHGSDKSGNRPGVAGKRKIKHDSDNKLKEI